MWSGPFFSSRGIYSRWVILSDIDGDSIISSRWVILSDIDREIIPGESLHTFQGIVSPPQQGSALVNFFDEAAFEEAKAHADFLDKSMGGRA